MVKKNPSVKLRGLDFFSLYWFKVLFIMTLYCNYTKVECQKSFISYEVTIYCIIEIDGLIVFTFRCPVAHKKHKHK